MAIAARAYYSVQHFLIRRLGLALVRKRLDDIAGYSMPAIFIAYIISFGWYRLHGVHTNFEPAYLTILLPLFLVDGLRGTYEVFLRRDYKTAEENLDDITVVIACKNGEDVIGDTIGDLLRRFRKQQVIVVSNDSTDRTCEIVQQHGAICLDVKKPLGKVRAINYALKYVTTPYVLLLDDDTRIGRARLPTGLFKQGYEAIAFRVFVRKSSWLTQFQAYEYRKSSDIGKRRHNKAATVQNISGAIGLFRLKELKRQVTLHSGEFSGEDLQRTLLLYLSDHQKGVVLANSIVYTEPPTTLGGLYRQRMSGWFPGLYSNYINFVRLSIKRHIPLAQREDAIYNYFLVMTLDISRFLTLPVALFYPWYFVIMYCTYVTLETVTYLRHKGLDAPYWVVTLYPFYGLFGLFTRLGALATFLYRRLATVLSGFDFRDDFRYALAATKVVSITLVLSFFITAFALNVEYEYSSVFTDQQIYVQGFKAAENLVDHL